MYRILDDNMKQSISNTFELNLIIFSKSVLVMLGKSVLVMKSKSSDERTSM